MIEARLLNELKKAQHDYALQALRVPSEKTEFEYGCRSGYVAGLESAIELLLKLLDEEKYGDRDL